MVRNAVSLFGGNFVQAAVAFAANLVLVRHINPEGFGRYALVAASISLTFSILSHRVGLLVIRESTDGMTASRRAFFINAIVLDAAIAGAVCLGGALLLGHLNAQTLALVGVGICANLASELKSFLERDMAFVKLTWMESLVHLLSHVLSVIFVLYGVETWALYGRDLFFAVFSLAGVLLVGQLRLVVPRLPRLHDWKQLLSQAGPGWFDQVVEQLFARAVILMAGAVGGERAAGIFFQAQRLAGVPHQFLAPLAFRLSFSVFSRQELLSDRQRTRNRILVVLAIPLAIAAVAAFFLSGTVVPLLLGAQWSEVAVTLASMSGAVMFITLFENLKAYAYSGGHWRVLALARCGQFIGLLFPALLWTVSSGSEAFILGVGLSFAYIAAFVVLIAGLHYRERECL
jgi:O-antigen/teichoic acid export membrane protein